MPTLISLPIVQDNSSLLHFSHYGFVVVKLCFVFFDGPYYLAAGLRHLLLAWGPVKAEIRLYTGIASFLYWTSPLGAHTDDQTSTNARACTCSQSHTHMNSQFVAQPCVHWCVFRSSINLVFSHSLCFYWSQDETQCALCVCVYWSLEVRDGHMTDGRKMSFFSRHKKPSVLKQLMLIWKWEVIIALLSS